jgi:hypothetical protein
VQSVWSQPAGDALDRGEAIFTSAPSDLSARYNGWERTYYAQYISDGAHLLPLLPRSTTSSSTTPNALPSPHGVLDLLL